MEDTLFSLHPDAKMIYNTINSLKNLVDGENGLLNPNSPLVYSDKMPVFNKIMFAVKYLNRMCQVSDIERVIKQFEPDFKKNISTPLSKCKKHGALFSVNTTGSMKSVWYGLFAWVGEDGKLKEEYLGK